MSMQGEQLKEARKRLGWTQGRLASELGLSATFIGLMERGDKAIERRTALAVRALELDSSCHLSKVDLAAGDLS